MKKTEDGPWLVRHLRPGNKIVIDRAVRIGTEEEVNNVSRITYCPKEKLPKEKYSRCSKPSQEMFYASLLFPEQNEGEINNARIISIAEASELYREDHDGSEIFIFGKWTIKSTLTCAVIVNPQGDYVVKYLQECARDLLRKLSNSYLDPLGQCSEASEWAKIFSKEISSNSDYCDSADKASQILENPKIDAIIYPSVQAGKQGCCIAIRPDVVDTGRIKLVKVLQTQAKKEGNEMSFKNMKHTNKISKDGSFHLESV